MNKLLFKKIYLTFITLALGSFLLAVSYKVYNENKDDLKDLTHYTGILTDHYITNKSSLIGGKMKVNKKFLAIEIAGLEQKIRVFRPNQNYTDFFQNVKKGDTVSIYFRSHSAENFNSDIYQLDINRINYLQIDKVKRNHSIGGTIVFILGLFICTMSIYVWKKAK